MEYSYLNLFLFYSLLLLLAIIGVVTNKITARVALFIQVVMIILFYGFRDINVGVDTKNYVGAYLSGNFYFEYGFSELLKLVGYFFHNNWRVMLLIITMLNSIFLVIFYSNIFQRNTKYVGLALCAAYSLPYAQLMATNVIRQGLGISLLIAGISILYLRKKKYGLIFIIIACTVHDVILYPLLIFLFLHTFKISRKTIVLLSFFFLLISQTNLISMILNLLSNVEVGMALKNKIEGLMALNRKGFSQDIKMLFYYINFLIVTALVKWRYSKDDCLKVFYYFFSSVMLLGLLLYNNVLISTRILMQLDYLIPCIYIYPISRFNQSTLHKIGWHMMLPVYKSVTKRVLSFKMNDIYVNKEFIYLLGAGIIFLLIYCITISSSALIITFNL